MRWKVEGQECVRRGVRGVAVDVAEGIGDRGRSAVAVDVAVAVDEDVDVAVDVAVEIASAKSMIIL